MSWNPLPVECVGKQLTNPLLEMILPVVLQCRVHCDFMVPTNVKCSIWLHDKKIGAAHSNNSRSSLIHCRSSLIICVAQHELSPSRLRSRPCFAKSLWCIWVAVYLCWVAFVKSESFLEQKTSGCYCIERIGDFTYLYFSFVHWFVSLETILQLVNHFFPSK